MYARVPQAMAQFVLKIEQLSHIMGPTVGPTPILEMARAYGLYPRLWLLVTCNCFPNRTNRSNRQASTRVPKYRKIFLSVANEMHMSDRKNSSCRIVQKILYSPNRTNRSNRQASSQVPEYLTMFQSVANEMQMSDRQLYLSDRPKKFSIGQIERIGQIDKLSPGSQNIVK